MKNNRKPNRRPRGQRFILDIEPVSGRLCNDIEGAMEYFQQQMAVGLGIPPVDESHQQECQLRYSKELGYGCTCKGVK